MGEGVGAGKEKVCEMTYRDLILKLIEQAPSLDNDAYVTLWQRDENGMVGPHKAHYCIAHYNMVHDSMIVELAARSDHEQPQG